MSTAKIDILKETFENEFNIDNFKRFIREFFNELELLPEKRRIGIWREYSDHINSYYNIANYTDREDNKLIVLAVELKTNTSIDRARSMQRNFISKILDENNLEAAIVAFYTENNPSWRLSFVRLDYSFTDKGIALDLTPARRYSYLVGKNEPNHTAQAQLLDIFQDDKQNPTLDEIETAFSVEKVTKDFFNQYKAKYLDLKEYLENNDSFRKEASKLGFTVNKFSEQFAKKLMGQLAFLYFLQKKGWLGVRIMPDDHTFTLDEFKKIYGIQDDIHKNILAKVFKRTSDGEIRLFSKKILSINEHEAGLLSDCFIGTEYDMPWGSGNKAFIREIFDFCVNNTDNNFFNDYLEPFFYDALNKKRRNHYFKTFNCKIPFLNGGLFEPLEGYHWKDVNFKIPNELFSNKNEKGKEANGILDIFDRFNFTMNEDEPLEKEIAVDPEMLGKIFENLLEVSDRKSKGAFYTPREIVHYMCQESLINYLVNEVRVPYDDMKEFILYGELIRDADNRRNVGYEKEYIIKESILNNIVNIDKAIENVRVADPAVGSGAFPLGMLNEIVRARNNITEYLVKKDKTKSGIAGDGYRYGEERIRYRRSIYDLKLKTIKNSIFAVDIEPSAVDIAKLRLWLSLVVEQEIDVENPNPRPLPNLDMNIHAGNSLIDEYEGIKLFDKDILTNRSDKDAEKGCGLNSNYRQISMLLDHTDEWLKEMFELQDRYFEEDSEAKKSEIKGQIDTLREQLIRYKIQGDKDALERYNSFIKEKTKPYFIWELEFAKVFKEKGGFDIFIGNPPYGARFTNKEKVILSKKYPTVPDFESADYFIDRAKILLKENGIISYIVPNMFMSNVFALKYRSTLLNTWSFIAIDNLSSVDVFDSAKVRNCIIFFRNAVVDFEVSLSKLTIIQSNIVKQKSKLVSKSKLDQLLENWLNLLEQSDEQIKILKKILQNSTPLGELAEISQGLIPYDKYRGHSEEIIKNRVWHADHQKDGTYRMELAGKDVDRYKVTWNGKTWISYGDWLAAPRKKDFFTLERILIREITNPRILAAYTSKEYYNTPSIINCINFTIDIKFVLGVINSTLMSFYHKMNSPKANKGLFPKILVSDVRKLPINVTDRDIQNEISRLVNEILLIKQTNEDSNTEHIESYIDHLVYELYGLTEEEIEVVKEL